VEEVYLLKVAKPSKIALERGFFPYFSGKY